jgi:DNA-directed RNA polymerase specialized sigma24 family protein
VRLDDQTLLPLIEAMATGDATVLPRFIEETGPWIHGAALRTTRSTVAAGVLVEAVLSELWRTAPLYDRHQGRPGTWILAVARAHGADWLEKRRGKASRLKTRPDATEVLPDGDEGAHPQALAAMRAVGPEHAAVLRRAWFGDPPGSEASSVSPDLLRRSVTALAGELGLSGGEDS